MIKPESKKPPSAWYYYDNSGTKHGPVTGRQLKWLAKNGKITPGTMVKAGDGRKFLARKIQNIEFVATTPFAAIAQTETPLPTRPAAPSPIAFAHPSMPTAQQRVPVPKGNVEDISKSLTGKDFATIAGGVLGGILVITLIIFSFAVWIPAAQERAQLERERIVAEREEQAKQERRRIAAEQERKRLADEQEQERLIAEQVEREKQERVEQERQRIAVEQEQQRLAAEQVALEETERRRVFEERRDQGLLRTEEIIELVEQSVARIEGPKSSGSGFLIQPQILATNYHVIDDMMTEQIQIQFPSAEGIAKGPFNAELLYADPGRDIALLRVETTLPPLPLAENHQFRRGQDIIAIGSPGKLENAVNIGVLSSERVIEGHQFYQLGIAINSGNSGGPIIDRQGNVIGIATLKSANQESIAYCIPLADVQRALTRAESLTELQKYLRDAMHHARVVFQMISDVNDIYLDCMDEIDTCGEIARDNGYSLEAAAAVGTRRVKEKMDTARLKRLKVEKELRDIEHARILSAEIQQKLKAYHSFGLSVKSYVDKPDGSFNYYRGKYNEFFRTETRLYKELRLLLGFPVVP